MAGFDAATAVDPLEYNLAPYVTGEGAKGIVPEPSQASMRTYRKAIMSVMNEYKDFETADVEKLSEQEVEDLQVRSEALEAKMDELTAQLCQNQPSAETLAKLPWRHKILFSKWLQEQFNPEALTSASKK